MQSQSHNLQVYSVNVTFTVTSTQLYNVRITVIPIPIVQSHQSQLCNVSITVMVTPFLFINF